MKPAALFVSSAILFLSSALVCTAQVKGYWRAASTTAESITGDISISENRLTINFSRFPMAQIRRLTPAETSAAFDVDIHTGARGTLYRLYVPAEKHFLRHNTLCGTEDTRWMAIYASGNSLEVAFFSGEKPPVFTMDALANSMELCGTFAYAR